MRQWLTFLVGGLCLTLAASVQALGVGEPQQLSPLNRPLHVVLPLTDGSGLETSQISVAIADDAAYRQSGLTRSALTDTVSAKVVREGGALSVVLDSPRRVKEPFLDLLLVVTWPEGQWQREISLLFDPVDYASTPPLIDGDRGHSVVRQALASSAADAIAAPVAATGNTRSGAAWGGSPAWPSRVTVSPGDSLSTLAASLLPHPGVSREALMVALFQSNPSAFIQGDVNRLRAGVSLDVLSSDDVAGMSRHDAAATLAKLSRTEDGRPIIDIVGHEATLATAETEALSEASSFETSSFETSSFETSSFETSSSDTQPSARLATLQQRVSDLTAEAARQRATIATLQAERDALQGALAAVDTPSAAAVVASSVASPSVSPLSSAEPVADRTSVGATTARVATSAVVAKAAAATPGSSPASLPAPSLWQRLLGNLDWIGGAVLIVLLGLWAWQRRRQRASHVEPPSSMMPASEKSSKPAAASRRLVAGDAESASISQADIYMAYGRHAEARDWLRRQLAQAEDAHLRLGLLRALGELREMEALEEALSGFDDDASAEQRQEGQALVDDYRARYVEESWQEATAASAEGGGEDRREGEDSGKGSNRDTGEDSGKDTSENENRHVWSGSVQDVDVLFDSQAVPSEAHADSFRPSSRDDLGGADDRHDSVSVLFEDDWPGSSQTADTSLTASCIDYEAPTLELDVTAADEVLASCSDSLNSREASSATPSETPPRPTIDFSALALEPVVEDSGQESADDGLHGGPLDVHSSWDVGRVEAIETALRPSTDKPTAEALEFQSSHRDNGRP